VNEAITKGNLPNGALPVPGYDFAIKCDDAEQFKTCKENQDWFKASNGKWYNCHILSTGMTAQADHYGCNLYATRGEADRFDLERSELE